MPKSKTDKSRKDNLTKFKQKAKEKNMSTEQKPIPQLRSFPVWKSQDTISVSGLEWESIYNVLNTFRAALVAAESVMRRNEQAGIVTTKFIDENDQEVAPEKVEEYTKQMQEFFKQKVAEEEAAKGNTPTDSEASPILSATGEKVKKSALTKV